MHTKQDGCDDLNVDDNCDDDDDIDIVLDVEIASDEKYEDETLPSPSSEISSDISQLCHNKWKSSFRKFKLVRYFVPLLALVVGVLLSTLWSKSWSSLVVGSRGKAKEDGHFPINNSTSAEKRPQTDSKNSPKSSLSHSTSPFFENVLEWKKKPSNDTEPYSYYVNDKNNSSNPVDTYYIGSIEFCSDPSKELYGYGPVGNCVPGSAAPLIRMQPKRFYVLTLFNNAHIDTNLHTHGLHVSGVGTVDDVTRVAKPGECLVYNHYILDDADVGTYWYHPHHHPQVQHSVYGGAYGMLIIDESDFVIDNQNYYPNHLANFLTKNEILLQFSSMYNEKSPNTARTNKVNGQENLELFLSPDSYYYFRISSVIYDGVINYVEFDPPGACDVRIVAYDGVYRSEIPGHTLINKHMMTVGSRVDLAVACHKYSHIHFHQGNITDLSKLVTIHLETAESRESPVSPSARNDSTSISVRPTLPSSPYWDIETETIWRPRRPYYMPDLSAPTNVVDDYWSVSMDDHFANGTHGHLLNQRKWDAHQSIKTFSLGQLVEYPIFNTQEHPYHSHINRMQIVEPGGCGGRFEEGEYFDTIFQAEKNPGGCRIRTKFFDFAGRVVIHCHRFEHEDHGMMAWIDVVGGDGHGTLGAPATRCEAVL